MRRKRKLPDDGAPYPKQADNLRKKRGCPSLGSSIQTAAIGTYVAVISEVSLQRILASGLCVLAAAFLLDVPVPLILLLLFAWASVMASEVFNTSMEKALDYASGKEYHPLIRRGKDYAAASVFILAAAAHVITLVILLPRLLP